MREMLKTLGKSVREYKKPALLTPVSYTHLNGKKRCYKNCNTRYCN